jgi:mRNA interferase RelE/StbE
MNYLVEFENTAEKDLKKLPKDVLVRLIKIMENLQKNPRNTDTKKLKGENDYRVRIGNWRVLYEINDKNNSVIIYHILKREDVYK